MRTHMMFGLAIATLSGGFGLAVAGLYPDIDSPPLSRLGLLIVLISIPLWNAVLLRRARQLRDDQLNDSFQAGYQLHAQHIKQAGGAQGPRVPRQGGTTGLDPTERHGR